MYALILGGAVLAILLISALFGLVRGFSKSAMRGFFVLLSAVAAIVTCLTFKNSLPNGVEMIELVRNNLDNIRNSLENGAEVVTAIEEILPYLEISPTALELVVQLTSALMLPLICLILFWIYAALSWVLYLIISLIFHRPMKEFNRNIPLSRLCGAGVGLVQGLVIVFVLLLPISAYLGIAVPTVDELVKQEILDADDPTMDVVLDAVDEINGSAVMTVYRTVGGRWIGSSMMQMKVANMDVKVEEELDSVIVLVQNITALGKTPIADYTSREAEYILAIGDAFGESKLIAPIMGDFLYGLTDAWINGEDFLGMAPLDMGEEGALIQPMIDGLLEIVHGDAKNPDALKADIKTIARMVSIMADSGMFANMSNTNGLLNSLGSDGVVNSIVVALGQNPSMKRLIPEITNLGIRAMGQALNIPQNVDAVHQNFMGTVAGDLNSISSLPEDQQISQLSAKLDKALDNAGVSIDDELLDFYATSMVHDLITNNPNGAVTENDVQAFFLLYANSVAEATVALSNQTQYIPLASTRPLGDETNPYAGSIYENMTKEELSKCAATVLANVCVQLSTMDAEAETFAQDAMAVVETAFVEILGEENVAMETIRNAEVTKAVTTKVIENTASLQSATEMEKTTTVVTMNDLLVDTKEAADKINEETLQNEADSVASIFNAASGLLDSIGNTGDGEGEEGSSNLNIADLANSVGTILDSLNQTASFGEEKTANLFTAVLQSETVRESVNLDMETATQMADKATSGGGNYSQTMNTVAGTVNVMESLTSDGNITEEELVDLIRNLTPQTAGMIEVFVTPARLIEFGAPEEHSEVTSKLITSLFSYMAREDLKDYDAEAKALNQVLNIALAAQDSEDNKLFSSAEGVDDGVLPTARETVNILLGSQAIDYALVEALTDGENVTNFDPYGLGESIPEDSVEYQEFEAAVRQHHAEHPETNVLVYEALMAMFGMEISFAE